MFGFRQRCLEGRSMLYPMEKLTYFGEINVEYDGVRLGEMIKSIRDYGIIQPILVRDTGKEYQVLSGFNRLRAAQLAEFKYVPVLNMGMISDDEAKFIISESKVMQRGFMEFSISQRARHIVQKHRSMKSCGFRKEVIELVGLLMNENHQGDILHPIDRIDAKDVPRLNARSIRRYIRIDGLDNEWKQMLDDGQLSIQAAVNVSFLMENHQDIVKKVMVETGVRLSTDMSVKIRIMAIDGCFSEAEIIRLLVPDSEVGKPKKSVRVRRGLVKKYFGDFVSQVEVEDVIVKALEKWFSVEGPVKR